MEDGQHHKIRNAYLDLAAHQPSVDDDGARIAREGVVVKAGGGGVGDCASRREVFSTRRTEGGVA